MATLACLWLLAMGASSDAQSQTPGEVAEAFATAWEARDESGVAALLAAGGIHLRLDGDGHGGLPPRRVLAALESYWAERTAANVTVAKVSIMEGRTSRAYGELSWRGVNDVTGEPFEATIFLGLAERDRGWRIDEIRTIAAG